MFLSRLVFLLFVFVTPALANTVTVSRSDILNCIGSSGACLKPAEAIPYKDQSGKQIGWKLEHVKKSDFLTRLGFKEKDVILSANGEGVTDSKRLPHWLFELLSIPSIDLRILRNGHPQQLELQFLE